MSPKLAIMAQHNRQVQLSRRNLAIHTSPGNATKSDVSTTDVVSFQTSDRSVLSKGGNAGSGRPDATTLLFGAGGLENVLLSIGVNELSRTHPGFRRKVQIELSALVLLCFI